MSCCFGGAPVAPQENRRVGSVTDGKYPEPTEWLPLTAEDVKDIKPRPNIQNSEVDENGNFIRQKNLFTVGFGDEEGLNPVEAGKYRLVWAKGCNWSNRASIVRELLGLDKAISVNLVNFSSNDIGYGWEFVYDEKHRDPVLGTRFLAEHYAKSISGFAGRATVPSLIDIETGKVVNNDYHKLTNYFEVEFKPYHKPGAPDLYPEELRGEIDKLNEWLFHNINNGVYKIQFAQTYKAYQNAYDNFYAAMDILENRLADKRFLFGDYVTDSDVRLYVTLARLDIAYAQNLGPTKHRLVDYPNLWGYARDLWQIAAFQNNTYFRDFAAFFNADKAKGDRREFTSFVERFVNEINFDELWGSAHGRQWLSSDPANKFRVEE